MSSGGLIYAVIVGLWAVVLVPMWLRRHDEVSESRSVDRFQGAMRTLSRKGSGAVGDRREVLRSRRTPATTARPDHLPVPVPVPSSSAAVRRRRSLLGLAGLLLVVVLLGFVGVLPWWVLVLPVALGAAFVGGSRLAAQRRSARELQARRDRAAAARRQRDAAVASRHRRSSRTTAGAATVPGSRVDPAASSAAAPLSAAPVAPTVEAAPVVAAVGSEPLYDAVAEHVWEPVPVPLPTYVTAPKAPRSVRVIDLTEPGAWTSGHLSDDEQAAVAEQAVAAAAAVRDPESIVTGEVLVERRRAVND